MTKRKLPQYRVLSNLMLGEAITPPGETVELDSNTATELIALGVVEPLKAGDGGGAKQSQALDDDESPDPAGDQGGLGDPAAGEGGDLPPADDEGAKQAATKKKAAAKRKTAAEKKAEAEAKAAADAGDGDGDGAEAPTA